MGSTTKSTSTNSNTQAAEARFELGQLCYTPGAQVVLQRYHVTPLQLLARHVAGDWGDVCPEDAQTNEDAIQEGSRIFSVYRLPPPSSEGGASTAKVWVITEADRSVTTLLLPEEY